MKKLLILFSFAFCTAFFVSCSKDQDRTSTGTERPSNGPAEDPYAEPIITNDSGHSKDSSSTVMEDGQSPNPSSGKAGSNSPAEKNTSNRNNTERTEKKDSVTSAAGLQGAGSGVGNGGSINAAKDAKKK